MLKKLIWFWLRILLWGVLLLLALDGAGILLTARPGTIEWETVNTTGFPPGPPHAVRALTVGPDGHSLFAGTDAGLFRSDNGGKQWRAVNQEQNLLSVWTLAIGPDGHSLFAGTFYGGVFRSDDGGNSWQAANRGLPDLDVRALLVGPDGRRLLAGTAAGVFHSDDGGDSWQVANQGLTVLSVRALALGTDGRSLLAGTFNDVYRSDDGGQTWQAVPDLTLSDLPTYMAHARTRIVATEGICYLTHPGMGWLSWATYHDQVPQAFTIQGNRASFYTAAGAATMLRAEVQLPLIWQAPTPYLAMVTATWQGIEWVGAQAE